MARGVDKKGRNIQKEHYTKLVRSLMDTDAWRDLSPKAQALYPWIRLEWHGPQFNNNGKIQFSNRQAAKAMGIGINAAMQAFRELQAKGFIVVTKMGALGIEGMARGPSYELTEIPLLASERPDGRKLYLQWRAGHDYPVAHHHANNPQGHNGRSSPSSGSRRTHLQNRDVQPSPVIETKTPCLENCDVDGWKQAATVIELKTSLYTRPEAKNDPPDLCEPLVIEHCPQCFGKAS